EQENLGHLLTAHPLIQQHQGLARLCTRPAAKPSRASAISALRSSSIRKPPRIMRPSESYPPPNARHFSRVLIESGYNDKLGLQPDQYRGAHDVGLVRRLVLQRELARQMSGVRRYAIVCR